MHADYDAGALDWSPADLERPPGGAVLVEYYLPWYAPSHTQRKVLEEVMAATDVRVGRVDVSRYPGVAEMRGVSSVPTVVLMKDGVEELRFDGMQPAAILVNAVKRLVQD